MTEDTESGVALRRGRTWIAGLITTSAAAPAPAREHVRVEQRDDANDAGQEDAVLEGEAEQPALVRGGHAGRGDGHRDARERDHLAHDAGRGIDRRRQDGIEAELRGGDHLEVAEERIR